MLTYFGLIRRFWTIDREARSEAAGSADRYTPLERDAVLLRYGEPGESLAISDSQPEAQKPWRFVGALQPPFC